MCLLFYVAGLVSGYIAWYVSAAPRLWDAKAEAKHWRELWLKLKDQEDLAAED